MAVIPGNKTDPRPGEHGVLFVATSDYSPVIQQASNDGRSTDSCFALIGAHQCGVLMSPIKDETAICGSATIACWIASK